MDAQYVGVAVTKDGRRFEITGTIMECASWADNIVRIEGECSISIVEKES